MYQKIPKQIHQIMKINYLVINIVVIEANIEKVKMCKENQTNSFSKLYFALWKQNEFNIILYSIF